MTSPASAGLFISAPASRSHHLHGNTTTSRRQPPDPCAAVTSNRSVVRERVSGRQDHDQKHDDLKERCDVHSLRDSLKDVVLTTAERI